MTSRGGDPDIAESGRSASGPGSQSALRVRNRSRILDMLSTEGALTQAELARRTRLSAATVSNIVRLLIDEGAVRSDLVTSSGRRGSAIRIESGRSAVAVGIDFGRRHLRIVVASPGYEVLAECDRELRAGYSARHALDLARGALDDLLDQHGLHDAAVLGVAVGVPGPIDRRSRTVVWGTMLPEWLGVTQGDIEDRLGHPVRLDNDANLGALAEVTWGGFSQAQDLVFVKVGSGIGAGLIIGGRPHYGRLGLAGEIGHSIVEDRGTLCRCGNRGCLETVASTSAMVRLLGGPTDRMTTAILVERALEGDPGTIRVLEDAGTAIGRVLGWVASFAGPEVVVIGGPLTDLGRLLTAPIARSLQRHAIPLVGESTVVTTSSLGARAEALGAASLALRLNAPVGVV